MEDVLNPVDSKPGSLEFYQAVRYLTDISNEVLRVTGWQSGIGRGVGSSGIQHGANCSSPLFKYADRFDRFLFIRTDADIKDGKTGSVVPLAAYRRANRVEVKNKQQSGTDDVLVYAKKTDGPNKSVIRLAYSLGEEQGAADITPSRNSSSSRFENWD
ncbi:hypothetical protein EJ02DRAFT_417816 [Clathrospora elynae]|uniref:Uncharacterized protein n=1 Tax=Clathrospora elynae TaxID=706981 RepID=A0A6A5T562_9PLEO|nr:hypothetical protein EJ02DRAFT_417816 [Clathrospora elynae]